MKHDVLKQFARLQRAILSEKSQIEARLAELNTILGAASVATPRWGARRGRPPKAAASVKNPTSLKSAVIQVTSATPLTRLEILEALDQMGYRFKSKNPLNSLGVLLYGNKAIFKKTGKKFSSSEGASSASALKPARKRKVSAEGKARIAAAQKARWAKFKANQA